MGGWWVGRILATGRKIQIFSKMTPAGFEPGTKILRQDSHAPVPIRRRFVVLHLLYLIEESGSRSPLLWGPALALQPSAEREVKLSYNLF